MEFSPCKDCQKRYVGCHAQCLEYIDWQQRWAIYKQQKYERDSIDGRLHKMNKNRREKAKEHYYAKRKY